MHNNFVWGIASAAFQVEGAYLEDGKKESIWDVMCHEKGKTKYGDTGDVACDHYHRYKEDVKLMADLGIKAYRFSIAWSRVLPDGSGAVNTKGLEFYDNLINELQKYGIEPYVTLYHWDLPQALYERGGWLNPEIKEWFYQYAKLIGEHFGDRVKNFITINEPSNIIKGMTEGGGNAPNVGFSLKDRLSAIHNVLKSHGRAVQALRETVEDVKIGYAPCCCPVCPEDENNPELCEEARRRFFSLAEGDMGDVVTLYCDPVFLGKYPDEYYTYYKDVMPIIESGDMELISQPIDYCFINIYSGTLINTDADGGIIEKLNYCPRNMLGWPIVPKVLYWGPKFLEERYGKPVMITENGYPCPDVICLDGKIHDTLRIDFVERYLREMERAIEDGVDIRGYFYWTILDNLEWELGFEPRFGLVYIDFDTLKRIPKDSYYYYQKRICKYSREA